MPPSYHLEYNPVISGFVEDEGYISLPLQEARKRFGEYPSSYGLVSSSKARQPRKALNLSLGLAITNLLNQQKSLKGLVASFYQRWYRDFQKDFEVTIEALRSLNDDQVVRRALQENLPILKTVLDIDLDRYLTENGLISLSTLRSISEDCRLVKIQEMLDKKQRNPAHIAQQASIGQAAATVMAKRLLAECQALTGADLLGAPERRMAMYADEIASLLWRISRQIPLAGAEDMVCVRGTDVEFEYATRDVSFLDLGKTIGDCTADKSFQQVDRNVENIYWTVFPWMLDYNYQILKVSHDGRLVMKVHLLPLLISSRRGEVVCLAVDAIETTPAFREDTRDRDDALLENRIQIFYRTIEEIRRIALRMRIEYVYAERFSNTAWVRKELDEFPEIYLNISDIRKVDELEDVFELARRVCKETDQPLPKSVFMELQMKNTFLRSGHRGGRGVKSYAVIEGDAGLGIPMKRIVGV